jgi:hypothetical protein
MKIKDEWQGTVEYYRCTYSTQVFVEIMLLIEILVVISTFFLFFYSSGVVEHMLYVFAFVFILVTLWYSIKSRKGKEVRV